MTKEQALAEYVDIAYIGWINQVEAWLNAVNLTSTDPEFDLYDWHAAWAIGLTPLTAVQYAREMAEAHAAVTR